MGVGDGGGGGPPRCDCDDVPKQAKRKMKTTAQLEALERAYTVSSTLSEQMRQELAQQTALSSREISMWFANKRFQGKQALFLREMRREDAHQRTDHSQPSESGSRGVLSAFHQIDSSKNEVFVGESSGTLPQPIAAPSQLGIQSQALQLLPQQQTSKCASDSLILTYVEKKLGGTLREDGPLVGMNFDPLPPGAFGAPFCGGSEVTRKLEQPIQAPKRKSFLNHYAVSYMASSIFRHTDSSCFQSSPRTTPVYGQECTVQPESVYNFSSKLAYFPSEKMCPETKEVHPDYALQADAQFVHPVNVVVDKFVITDTLANNVTSHVKRLHKSEEARTANFIEALDFKDACTKGAIKSKEMTQPKELHLGAAATGKAGNGTFNCHGNIQGNTQLIDDEQLELMKLAASSKGLSSIDFLDRDTLDNLHTFQDMLGIFPPKSVVMKQPFSILPWAESEEQVGNLLMVWKFLVTFAGEFGLWPFTLDEFAQAFHDHDSRLLGEIHVALLKFIVKDLEDTKNSCAYTYGSEDKADNQGNTCLNIVYGAHAWGFDIHFWKKKLNFLTWPEILRQFGLSAGFGPQLNKEDDCSNIYGDKSMNAGDQVRSFRRLKQRVNAGDQVARFDSLVADGIKSDLVLEDNSSRDSSYQLTPGTLMFAVFHALFHAGSEGLTSVEVANYVKEHGFCNLTAPETAHASITNILLTDTIFFEKVGLLAYRLKPCFQKDPFIAGKMFANATEILHLSRNTLSEIEISNRNFEYCHAVRNEYLGSSFDEYHLGSKFTSTNCGNLNGNEASTSFSNHYQNMHPEAGLVTKGWHGSVNEFSSVFCESSEEDRISTRNDESFDSIHEHDGVSADIKTRELFPESWVQELTKKEYSCLSTEERLKVLVSLVGVIVDGKLFHTLIEERLKEARACKKMMLAKILLNIKLDEERLNSNPSSISKQIFHPCSHSNISNVSIQEKDLGPQFPSSSNSNPHEAFEQIPAVHLSQLDVYIDQKVEMIHSYNFLPLGKDRRHNRYWQFSTSSSRNDPGTGKIFFESIDGFWMVIDTDEAFDAILSALDPRGIRESDLCFMLKRIEIVFKETTSRRKNRELLAESTTVKQATIAPDYCTSDYRTISVLLHSSYETSETSASLDIDFLKNEKESSSSKKCLRFMKWMWQECFNPALLCAMRFGTKRCMPLLETCHICYQSYLTDERHCRNCDATFDVCYNDCQYYSEHVAHCELDFERQLTIPFSSINIQLLKAQLAIIEASIPLEAFHPFWNEGYRKSWGIQLYFSSSAREIFQSLTLLEGAIKTVCLCPDFVTTNELLFPEKTLFGDTATFSEPVPVIPWIPDTSAAVALRLLDLDSSIPYMLQHGIEPLQGTEVGEYLVLPRSKVVEPADQVESAVSDGVDSQNRGRRKQDKDGGGKESCAVLKHKIFRKHTSMSEDSGGSCYGGEFDISTESSGSLGVDETPAISSYEMNAGSANLHTKTIIWDGKNVIERGDEHGGEAIGSNELHRWQETVNSYLDTGDYMDERPSESRLSNIVVQPLGNRWDVEGDVLCEKGSVKGAVREENSSSSVNANLHNF